jgi:hypothetical protein
MPARIIARGAGALKALAALALLAGGLSGALASADDAPGAPVSRGASNGPWELELREAIARLRSTDPKEREAGVRAILDLGAEALPIVRRELEASNTQANLLRAIAIELDPQSAPRKDERWYETKFREAARRIERGDPLGAWKILDAILTIEPDCPIRDRIQALRVRARALGVRAAILDARLVPKRVLLAPGEPIEISVEAKNVSGQPLDFAFEAREGEVYGAVEIDVFSAAPGGARTRRREIRQVCGRAAARLEPGESWRTRLDIEALEPAPPNVFRRVRVSGSIRPAFLARGEERVNSAVPLFPVDVIVVDRAHQALAADPLGAAREALRALREAPEGRAAQAAAERLFLAALIAATTAREAAIDLLAPAVMDGEDTAGEAATDALAALAEREPDRRALKEWLRRRGGL